MGRADERRRVAAFLRQTQEAWQQEALRRAEAGDTLAGSFLMEAEAFGLAAAILEDDSGENRMGERKRD